MSHPEYWLYAIFTALVVSFLGAKILKLQKRKWVFVVLSLIGAVMISNYILSNDSDAIVMAIFLTIISTLVILFLGKIAGLVMSSNLAILNGANKRPETVETNVGIDKEETGHQSEIAKEKIESELKEAETSLSTDEIFKLKDLIAKNEVITAIDSLKGQLKLKAIPPRIYDEIVILESRLNQVEASVRKGIIGLNEQVLEINQIRDNLLAVINQLQPD